MGRPVHFEIHAAEPERAIAFYTALFDWTFERWEMGEFPYWTIKTGADGPGIDGGLLPRPGPAPEPGAGLNGFAVTVGVADLDATLATAQSHGGTIALPEQTIPGVGRLAYLLDPEGNTLGILQPQP
jgi:uncharacterized protein